MGPCLGLGLFMSYIRDLFFIFSFIFIFIISKMSLKQTHLFFAQCYSWVIMWMRKANNSQIMKIRPQDFA